ncbi:MAG: TIGR03032 family protein [Cyanobacteria bacterium]|nr:TIGR03032 family protein [Cyanobacteriota bacterium]
MTSTMTCFDPGLPRWLQAQNIALVLSTYRANRLLMIGTDEQAKLKLQERLYDRPMGLFAAGNSLWLAGRCHLWRFDNLLAPGQEHEGADRLYVPAASFLTGEVNAHELVLDGTGEPLFVNTLFSCLARLGVGSSFEPLWQPPFIDAIAAEDRCHLNGVALQDGEPTWVTACSSGNSPTSWRLERQGGGVLIHLPSAEIAARGLTMPHSPRWHAGRLWLLNSGSGELGWIDQGVFKPLCWLPGFVRGLAFVGDCALVGLSKLRSPQFTGLPLEERLQAEGLPEGKCGLRVIDLNSGAVLHSLDLPEPIDELFDLVVLEGVRHPRALGLLDEEIDCLVKLPHQDRLIRIKPSKPSGSPYQGEAVPRLGLPQPTASMLRYQRVFQLTAATLAPYAALTYPSLAPGSTALQALRGELLGISAMADGVMVGLVIAERAGATAAAVVSLMVDPSWRSRGIGTRLLHHLMQFLAEEGIEALSIRYQAPCGQPISLDRILSRLGWAAPKQQFLLLGVCCL